MADLSQDNQMPCYGDPIKIEVPAVGADTFYKGSLVFADASNGKAQVDGLAAGDFFLGICAEQTVADAADDLVPIYVTGVWGFKISGTTAADVGHSAVVDISADSCNPDDVISGIDATEAAGDIRLGGILSVHDSRAWVNLTGSYPIYADANTDGHASWRYVAES